MKKYNCYIVIIILSLSVFSCSQQNIGENSQTSIDSNFEKQKHSQSFTSNIISFPCAIILTPTSKFIDSLKKTDAENLKIELEEIISYHNEAQEYFNSHQIKIIRKTSEGNLKFHMTQNKDTTINLAGFYWSILLYNGKDAPIHMGRSDFDLEVNEYMDVKQ